MSNTHGFEARNWGYRKAFWTKRKKTAASLLSVVAMLAGVAVAFKLFDQTVPNNVVRDASVFGYSVEKLDDAVGDADWETVGATQPVYEGNVSCTPQGKCADDIYPGDGRSVDVRITNTNDPARDASFELFFRNLRVFNAAGTQVATTDANYNKFLNLFRFDAEKQLYLHDDALGNGDITETRMGPACSGGLKEITATSPCQLGVVKKNGSTTVVGSTPVDEQPTDQRQYEFTLSEADDGSNQSAFKGWYVNFEMVFNARVPALSDASMPER